MNTPETSSPSTPNSDSAAAVNPDIDQIINNFLDRANDIADDPKSDPKAVCALGWLVLKIKQFQVDNQSGAKTKPSGLTPETIRLLEEKGKML